MNNKYIITRDSDSPYLEHYGVAGMKWDPDKLSAAISQAGENAFDNVQRSTAQRTKTVASGASDAASAGNKIGQRNSKDQQVRVLRGIIDQYEAVANKHKKAYTLYAEKLKRLKGVGNAKNAEASIKECVSKMEEQKAAIGKYQKKINEYNKALSALTRKTDV